MISRNVEVLFQLHCALVPKIPVTIADKNSMSPMDQFESVNFALLVFALPDRGKQQGRTKQVASEANTVTRLFSTMAAHDRGSGAQVR